MCARRGFTLVELLVVIVIIGVLIAMLLPAVQGARASARRTQCASGMRQVGLAIRQYCDTHHGLFPPTTGSSDPDPTTGLYLKAWIYAVAPHMEDVDAIRICPDDLNGDARKRMKMTSYAMNSYLSTEYKPSFQNCWKLKETSKTIVAFELANAKDKLGSPQLENDHVHATKWFSPANIAAGAVYDKISAEVQLDRHHGGAHYLYADGHVSLIPATQINVWAKQPFNFAIPPR